MSAYAIAVENVGVNVWVTVMALFGANDYTQKCCSSMAISNLALNFFDLYELVQACTSPKSPKVAKKCQKSKS